MFFVSNLVDLDSSFISLFFDNFVFSFNLGCKISIFFFPVKISLNNSNSFLFILKEGLYLFGMREVKTGKQLTYNEVLKIGHNFGVKCTDIYDNSYDDILNQVDNYKSSEKEGWVIGLVDDKDNVFKAKLKTTDYILMHKAITKIISPNAIIQAIEGDRWDDFKTKIPNSYQGIANHIAKTVYRYNSFMQNSVRDYYNELKHLKDRKEFMVACENSVPKVFRSYVKNVYLNIPNNFIKTNTGHYRKLHEMESIMTKYKKEYCNA